jgi:hypothetical protein
LADVSGTSTDCQMAQGITRQKQPGEKGKKDCRVWQTGLKFWNSPVVPLPGRNSFTSVQKIAWQPI